MKVTLQDNLINILIKTIQELPPDSQVPSERQVANKYQVSRTTVRMAMKEIESTGIIRRIRGKGTFVNRISLNNDLNSSYSFTKQMKAMGKVPETKIIDFVIRRADTFLAKKMGLEQGDQVIKVKRLRLADDQPMMIERTYLPCSYFKNLTPEMLKKKPMYDIFAEDYDERIYYADEFFVAGVVNHRDAQQLEIVENDPCLNLQRTTYNVKEDIIEFTLSVARSDQFSYHIRHQIDIPHKL